MDSFKVKRAIFISDLHLKKTQDERYQKILLFLRTLRGKIDHLFVLGDAFEFWYNDRSAFLNEYKDFLAELILLKNSGCKLVFFEGNHDINYGNFFKNKLEAKIYRKSEGIEINEKKVYLGHGDELSKGDKKYLFLRWLLRCFPVKLVIRLAPSKLVLNIALFLSGLSRGVGQVKSEENQMSFEDAARQKIKEGFNTVMFAHIHFPKMLEIENGMYINTGSWINRYSYVEYKNNQFEIQKYQ